MFGYNAFWKADPINMGIGLKKHYRRQIVKFVRGIPLVTAMHIVRVFYQYIYWNWTNVLVVLLLCINILSLLTALLLVPVLGIL